MLKYIFTAITGLATLFGVSYQLLKGAPLYIALALSLVISLGATFAWYQNDRVKILKATLHPLILDLLKNIGAEAVPLIIEISKRPGIKNELIDLLIEVLSMKPDPTERYWIYIILGKIGGKRIKSVIKKGILDKDELARLGAKEAWKLINHY